MSFTDAGEESGNHETGGAWKQGALEEDLEDLVAVVDYLKATYGYVVDLVVGHSRGSLVAFRWLCTSEEGKLVSGYVNASGRYRMNVRSSLFELSVYLSKLIPILSAEDLR